MYVFLDDVQHAPYFGQRGPQGWLLAGQDYSAGATIREAAADGGRRSGRLGRCHGLLFTMSNADMVGFDDISHIRSTLLFSLPLLLSSAILCALLGSPYYEC